MIASHKPSLGVIGCGAIAEMYHLPALVADCSRFERLVLADPNDDRRLAMAEKFDIDKTVADYKQLEGQVDGVIVAVPPSLHAPISLFFLQRGVHVLCEKPLTESLCQAEELVDAAERNRVALAVNQTRRLFPTYGKIRQLIAEGALGKLQSITYHDGIEFDWPAASPHHFHPTAHGTWSDTGVHLLDTVCWWLDAKPRFVSSQNDAFGGPEAMATVRLEHDGCRIEIKVSRLGRLSNGFSIVGSDAAIAADAEDWNEITVRYRSGRKQRLRCGKQRVYSDCAKPLLQNFLDVCRAAAGEREGRELPIQPLISGKSTLPTIELLEAAYQHAETFDLPWNHHWRRGEALDVT